MNPAPCQRRAVAFAAVSALALGGCVGIPFALPPTRVEVGSGLRDVSGLSHTAAPEPPSMPARGRSAGDAPAPTTDNPIELAAGVYPLGFGRQLLDRRVDIGVGYTYQGGPRAIVHGAYLEGQGMIGRWSLGEDGMARVGLRTRLKLLGEESMPLLGRGASVGVFAELVSFGAGAFGSFDRDGGVVGVSAGEGGIGIAVDAGYAQIDRLTVQSVTGSLTVRIPILAGFAFRWLWALDKK